MGLMEIYQALANLEVSKLTSEGLKAAHKTFPDSISGDSYPFTMRNPFPLDPGKNKGVGGGTKDQYHEVEIWLVMGKEQANPIDAVIEDVIRLGDLLLAVYKDPDNAALKYPGPYDVVGNIKDVGKAPFTLLALFNELHWCLVVKVTVKERTLS